MSTPSFWRGAAIALALSLAGAIVHTALVPVLGAGAVWRGLIVMLGAAYVALLLRDLKARVGRVVVGAGWLAITLALCAFDPRLWVWMLGQATLIWLVRSLYRYDGLASALADAALGAFAIAAALATATYTRSVVLTLWAYFLVHALYVLIGRATGATAATGASDDPFDQACRTAETALRRLSLRTP